MNLDNDTELDENVTPVGEQSKNDGPPTDDDICANLTHLPTGVELPTVDNESVPLGDAAVSPNHMRMIADTTGDVDSSTATGDGKELPDLTKNDDGLSVDGTRPSRESKPRTHVDRLPVDTGWAWMVLLGSALQMMLFIGLSKSFGIIFVEFQRKFHSTASMTSLLSTVQTAVYSVSALAVMKLDYRHLIMIGSAITATAYVITATAQDLRILFFSQGVLQGLGTSFMQPCALAMIGIYFNKRRGFANSVAAAGGSLGGLVLAALLTAMFTYYGYTGCLLIVAGLYLHGFVSGALFRPLAFYTRPRHLVKQEHWLLGEVDDDNAATEDVCVYKQCRSR